MPVLLSHNTALELLRGVPPQVRRWEVAGELLMEDNSTDLRALRGMGARDFGVQQQPLNVLVARGAPASKSQGLRTRWFGLGSIPAGLMLRMSPDVYVAGPELCFVQMAQLTSLVGAVVLGCELCGGYSHFPRLISGFYERPPLTSVEKLRDALESLEGLYGLGRARAALEWVRNASRSPMETVVSCEFHLPGREHGLAFQKPELNHRVPLDDEAAAITGTRSCYVDAAWPGVRRGLEYDSALFHRDPARDLRRREALQHMGWDIYTINVDQMADHAELMKTVALIADEIPRQEGGPAPDDEVAVLHRRLLRATRCGMGLEAALFSVPVRRGQVKVHL